MVAFYGTNFYGTVKKPEFVLQINANELYPIVKSSIIMWIWKETELLTPFIQLPIRPKRSSRRQNFILGMTQHKICLYNEQPNL